MSTPEAVKLEGDGESIESNLSQQRPLKMSLIFEAGVEAKDIHLLSLCVSAGSSPRAERPSVFILRVTVSE